MEEETEKKVEARTEPREGWNARKAAEWARMKRAAKTQAIRGELLKYAEGE